ncbi:MAG: TIM44-like domain-containing protein [Devosia sp.]|nr:TIM44-like domain-containing protein [Devosia sp.]
MFASPGFRLTALLATLIMAFSMVTVDTAQARRGGSFGSRGVRTERAIPATPTSPKVTTPVQRSLTDASTQRSAAATTARPSLFGGFGGAILGGLLFSGLFGMMFGYGFGGLAGMLALIAQAAFIGLILAFVFRRRTRPAVAGVPNGGFGMPGNSDRPSASAAPRSNASRRSGSRDEIGITDADLNQFERRLQDLQSAYSREDVQALRRIATPTVLGVLSEELARNASNGVRNEVVDVRLLEGDIAEAWRTDGSEFASVAMRYESRDVMRNRATGEIVAGEDRVSTTTEIWTFRRQDGGPWLIIAIQEA